MERRGYFQPRSHLGHSQSAYRCSTLLLADLMIDLWTKANCSRGWTDWRSSQLQDAVNVEPRYSREHEDVPSKFLQETARDIQRDPVIHTVRCAVADRSPADWSECRSVDEDNRSGCNSPF